MASSTIQILSAGAPKTGVRKCMEAHRQETGQDYTIEFATAPVIEERVLSGGSVPEIIIAPLPKMKAFAEANHITGESITVIGSIAAGVVVRDGSADPDLSTVDTLIVAIRESDGLVYNQASSGRYIATLIEELGLAEAVAAKTVRVPTGAAVMEHVAERNDDVIGFGQITEIRLHEHLGVHLVGPLPVPVGKITTYAAGLSTMAEGNRPASRFLAFMDTEKGRRILSDTGVELPNR